MAEFFGRLSDMRLKLQLLDKEIFERGSKLAAIDQKMSAVYRGIKSTSAPVAARGNGDAQGLSVEESLVVMSEAIRRMQTNLARQAMDISSLEHRADAIYGLGVAGVDGTIGKPANHHEC